MIQPPEALAQGIDVADDRTILDLENQFLQARTTGDTPKIRASFATDAVYIYENGDVRSRSGLEADITGQSYWLSFERLEPTLTLYRDAAVSHAVLSIRLGGGQIDKVRTTGVYARRDGVWEIVSWQSTPLLPLDPQEAKP